MVRFDITKHLQKQLCERCSVVKINTTARQSPQARAYFVIGARHHTQAEIATGKAPKIGEVTNLQEPTGTRHYVSGGYPLFPQ